jgi:hypothetical protein
MACGCKKGITNRSRTPVVRPTSNVRAVNNGPAAGPTPTQLRMQAMATPQPQRSPSGAAAEQRKVQAARRQAIRRALGK